MYWSTAAVGVDSRLRRRRYSFPASHLAKLRRDKAPTWATIQQPQRSRGDLGRQSVTNRRSIGSTTQVALEERNTNA